VNREELEEFIHEMREKGYEDDEIVSALKNEGVAQEKIENAFGDLEPDSSSTGQERQHGVGRNEGNSGDEDGSLDISDCLSRGISLFKTAEGLKALMYLLAGFVIFRGIFFALERYVGSYEETSFLLLGLLGLTSSLMIWLLSAIASGRTILSALDFSLEKLSALDFIKISIRYAIAMVFFILAVLTGFLLLVIPGIYIALALVFFDLEAIRGKGVVESAKSSWSLTKGHKLEILGLNILIALINIVPGIIFNLPASIAERSGYTLLSTALSSVSASVSFVLYMSVTAAALKQLDRTK